MKKIFLVFLIVLSFSTIVHAADYKYVVEDYIVQQGETVEDIAGKFILKNTYGPREIREFISGIRELNDIPNNEDVIQGQAIKISYWIAEKGNSCGNSK